MAVTLRLMRLGKRGKAFYRIVAVDKRKKRTGGYIEKLGIYNPLKDPAEISFDKDRFNQWIKKGALISEGLRKLLKYEKRLTSMSSKKT